MMVEPVRAYFYTGEGRTSSMVIDGERVGFSPFVREKTIKALPYIGRLGDLIARHYTGCNLNLDTALAVGLHRDIPVSSQWGLQ